jgi:hypothetical protein
MSRSPSLVRICCSAVVLVMAAVVACSAQSPGKQRVRPIEFSPARSDEVTTNLHQLTSRKDGLKQLEEDLYAPLQHFTPHSSLDGVMAPPPPRSPAQSAVQSKRVKDLLERRNNWVFMTPEDLLAGPTVDEVLKKPEYGPDGRDKQDRSAAERFYERIKPKRSTKPSKETSNEDIFNFTKKSARRDTTSPELNEQDLPDGVRDSVKALFEGDEQPSPFSEKAKIPTDMFGTPVKPQTLEQIAEHKKYMDQYHMLVDSSWRPPTGPSLLSTLPDPAAATPKPMTASPGLPSSSPYKAQDDQLNVLAPLLGPPVLPDVNARALGQTRPASTVPTVEPRRVIPPPANFSAPKRSF